MILTYKKTKEIQIIYIQKVSVQAFVLKQRKQNVFQALTGQKLLLLITNKQKVIETREIEKKSEDFFR